LTKRGKAGLADLPLLGRTVAYHRIPQIPGSKQIAVTQLEHHVVPRPGVGSTYDLFTCEYADLAFHAAGNGALVRRV